MANDTFIELSEGLEVNFEMQVRYGDKLARILVELLTKPQLEALLTKMHD